ncbi:amino acid adenylation domain-containing protein [Pseudoalteromonas sp. T1lg65]|uniref:amino acid adenylation domain-containing protein n=1 Tax=Pseudoalteromonas sp. T1lg65 TaxID=2077101 RepID=UPI003F7AA9E6
MSIQQLLSQLKSLGVVLGVNDGKLKLVDPNKQMTPELMQSLKQHKDAILQMMSKGKRFSSADFPLAKLDDNALSQLQSQYPLMDKVMLTTPMQQGLLFHGMLDNSSYISNTYCTFVGELNLTLFKQAWQTMIDRHEIYRTCFIGFDQEHIHQLVQSKATLSFDYQDWTTLSEAQQQQELDKFHGKDMKTGFNFATAPLFRLAIFKLDSQQYHFSWTRHHVISDGWCSSIVFAEVMEIYQALLQGRAANLPEPVPLDAYIEWLNRQDKQQALEYWQAQLGDVGHTTTFGIEQRINDEQVSQHKECFVTIKGSQLERLVKLARSQQTTMNTVVQAVWSYLLHLYSGESVITMGSTISGRPPELPHIERMIGIFINTIPVVSRFTPELTIAELLEQLHQANLHSTEFGYLSLSDVQKCSALKAGSLFNNIIVFDNYPVEQALANGDTASRIGMQVKDIGAHSQNNYDISLTAAFGESLVLRLLYNDARFSEAQIKQLQLRLAAIIEQLAEADASKPVAQLNVLQQDEVSALVTLGMGQLSGDNRDHNILARMAQQALQNPDAIAIDDGHSSLTYAQLSTRVAKLASFLEEQGIEPEERVGVYFERTTEMLISTLAILKTGAAYVMLEPRNTEQRLLHIINDAGIELVLVQPSLMAQLPLQGIDVITIEEHAEPNWLDGYDDHTGLAPKYTDLDAEAYVIYTSGSTGVPKGVSVPHRGLSDYCAYASEHYYSQELDGSLVVTSHGFDISIPALFLPLMHGHCVELLPWGEELAHAVTKLTQHQAKHYLIRMTPLHVAGLLDLLPESFEAKQPHVFVIGGEQLTYEVVTQLHKYFPQGIFYNHYGPSEAVVGCALFPIHHFNGSGSVPIGKAMDNTMLLVLDKSNTPVPQGMVGELYVAGPCVTNGYVNLPELTAEKFVANPYAPSDAFATMYNTGDVVRFDTEGNLVYLGRSDDQIKLRGFRIELGEVVACILEEQAITNAVAIVKEQRLLAYAVTNQLSAEELQGEEAQLLLSKVTEQLRTKLPEYMVPDSIQFLEQIPLTANGKLDKRALPDAAINKERVLPRTELEQRLFDIWATVLNHQDIGVFDSFFELGGHSILATRLISVIRKELGSEVPLKALFEQPTIAKLAKFMSEDLASENTALPELLPAEAGAPLIPSYAQKRLFFIDSLENGSAQFNMSGMFSIRGNLNRQAFESSLTQVIERHQVLRTQFVTDDEALTLVVSDDLTPAIKYSSLVGISEPEQTRQLLSIAKHNAMTCFDLSKDKLFRVELVSIGNDEYVAIFNMHHIASDGWSMGLLVKEFTTLYQAHLSAAENPLPMPTVQYSDFAHWQQTLLASEAAEQQMAYWKSQLRDIPAVHSLPLDKPRPAKQSFAGAVELQHLSSSTMAQVDAFCKTHRVTRFMLLQTVFSLLLSRYSETSDIVVGTPIAGRFHQNTESLIGCFVNSLVLRTQLQPHEPFAELLQRNKQMILEAFDNQLIPFDLLVEELNPVRNLAHDPIFQVVFSLNNTESQDLQLEGLQINELQQPQTTSKSELEVSARELPSGELAIRWIYRTDLFASTSIGALVQAYEALLLNVLRDADTAAEQIGVITEHDAQKMLVHGQGDFIAFSNDISFAKLFEAQVEQTPNAPAIKFKEQIISYAELNAKANQLAEYLVDTDVHAGDRVGIYLERSPEMVLAILAINKAGASYVPLEPDHPASRVEYIIEDSQIELVLTRSSLLEKLKLNLVDVMLLEDAFSDPQWLEEFTSSNPCHATSLGEHEMYVLYTSGTTGKPKGVQIKNSGLVNYLQYAEKHYLNKQLVGSVVSSPLCFDATITSLLTPLVAGMSVTLLATDSDVLEQLSDYLFDPQNAYLFKITPAHLNALSLAYEEDINAQGEHVIVVGGEQLTKSTLVTWQQRLTPNAVFVNEYGPTETVVGCSTLFIYPDSAIERENVSIGQAISNTQLYVLDNNLQVLPPLFQGELYIGGAGVAIGYANNAQLSKEKFITNPFDTQLSAKLYRSGDQARWLSDGSLEFLGRNDDQIKLHGYRIELREIERQLLDVDGVNETIVIKVAEPTEKLVAYVVPSDRDVVQEQILQAERANIAQQALSKVLPSYMVPTQYVFISAMPLTTNGKVDVRALPKADEVQLSKEEFIAASNEIEQTLCDIWQQLLNVEKVGIDDNYFALGGDSIISIQIVSRARKQGLYFAVRDIFDNQTVRTLATVVQQQAKYVAEQGEVTGSMPLLPIQSRFLQLPIEDNHHFNQSVLLSAANSLQPDHLVELLSALYHRHDALRLRISEDMTHGEFAPLTDELIQQSIMFYDFSALPKSVSSTKLTETCSALQGSFRLDQGSLFKVAYFDLGNQQKRVFIVAHHLVVDAVSWRVMLRDLENGFEQLLNAKPVSLGEKTSSLQQWALALSELVHSPALGQEKQYWLEQLVKPYPQIKFDVNSSQSVASRVVLSESLTVTETQLLLNDVGHVYRTEINEVLLAALALAAQKWIKQDCIRVELEGHGREELFDTLDITETVGWFTSLYPLVLDCTEASSTGDVLKAIKEQYRAIPNHGIGYGLLTEMLRDDALRSLDSLPESQRIYFNYLGQFDATLEQSGGFAPASEERGSSFSSKQKLNALANITAAVSDAQFQLSVTFNPEIMPQQQAQQLLLEYMSALREILLHCSATDLAGFESVSDLEESDESSEEFLI